MAETCAHCVALGQSDDLLVSWEVKPAGKLSKKQWPPWKTDAIAELNIFFLVNKLGAKERREGVVSCLEYSGAAPSWGTQSFLLQWGWICYKFRPFEKHLLDILICDCPLCSHQPLGCKLEPLSRMITSSPVVNLVASLNKHCWTTGDLSLDNWTLDMKVLRNRFC